jgi:heptosyltransferase I
VRLLLVKLSSMGDVIHNFPVVSDLVRAFPSIEIDWLTEAPYVDLVRMHPDVKQVFPLHLRALKKRWYAADAWKAFLADKAAVINRRNERPYDAVLDTQGLVKSAFVARWGQSTGTSLVGYSRETVREPFAARIYDKSFNISREQHAVTRNRALAATAFGYALEGALDYGIAAPSNTDWPSRAAPYAVLLHATSRENKQWPFQHWCELGNTLAALGFQTVLPWGNVAERAASEKLAAAIPHAFVPPALSLSAAAAMLAGASQVIGVDTGLAHLAVALKRPTVGLYVSTSPALTGLFGGDNARNLGGGNVDNPSTPSVKEVVRALKLSSSLEPVSR